MSTKGKDELHEPVVGDTFTLGFGPGAETCDVVSAEGDAVKYVVRRDNSEGFFYKGSPQHRLAKWW